jgi:cytochrome P450 family 135
MPLPPGPREPAALQTVEWVARPTAFLRRCHARHGGAFTVRVAWADAPMVLVSEPEDIHRVFTAEPGVLLGGSSSTVLEPFAGPSSILLLDGPEHLRQRRLMLPPFQGDALRGVRATIAELARAEVASWPSGAPLRALGRMQALTLDVILRTVFGPGERPRLRAAIRRALDMTASPPRLVAMSLTGHDRRPWRAFRRAVAEVDELLAQELAGPPAPGSILAILSAARHDERSGGEGSARDRGSPPTPRELRDQVVTLLAAGHETTAGSLAWALERLAHHPEALARIRDRDEEHLDATVKEVLRVRPVLSIAARKLAAPFEVAGTTLPPGVHVAPCIYLAHRRPEAWEDPTAFRPERFLGAAPAPYTYLPFGGGVRRCAGAAFAVLEMKEVLRAVAERVELRPAAPRGERMIRRSVTLTPARGAVVVPEALQPVQSRCPSSAATTA